jgi:hypothetical protein
MISDAQHVAGFLLATLPISIALVITMFCIKWRA